MGKQFKPKQTELPNHIGATVVIVDNVTQNQQRGVIIGTDSGGSLVQVGRTQFTVPAITDPTKYIYLDDL